MTSDAEIIEKIQTKLQECKENKTKPEVTLSGDNKKYKAAISAYRDLGILTIVISSIITAVFLVLLICSFMFISEDDGIATTLLYLFGTAIAFCSLEIGFQLRNLKLSPSTMQALLIILIIINLLFMRGLLPLIVIIGAFHCLRKSNDYREWFCSMVDKNNTKSIANDDEEDDEEADPDEEVDSNDDEDLF